MRLRAYAKVNLDLRVRSPRPDGLHPLSGLFASVSWHDDLTVDVGEEDSFAVNGGGAVPGGADNLAWRAAQAVRDGSGSAVALAVELTKRIPTAAGLGGGSADAAAALAGTARIVGAPGELVTELAPGLGSDVPFCLVGGFARVEGVGEAVTSLEALGGFALGIVVPPIELPTPAVYAAWDRLGGPHGPELADREVPPALRSHAPLRNDLTPAAIDIAPGVAEWRSELESAWGRRVALSGSGPSLFAYFLDLDEAGSALAAAPRGARAAEAVVPVAAGWTIED